MSKIKTQAPLNTTHDQNNNIIEHDIGMDKHLNYVSYFVKNVAIQRRIASYLCHDDKQSMMFAIYDQSTLSLSDQLTASVSRDASPMRRKSMVISPDSNIPVISDE